MLTYIEIEGFRSFRHIKLDLSGLTVLIGPNSSGKSNLLDIFVLMSQAALGRLSEGIAKRGGINTLLFRGGADRIFLDFEFAPVGDFLNEKGSINYKLHLRPVGALPLVWFEQVSTGPVPPQINPTLLMHRDKPRPMALFRRFGAEQWPDFDLNEQLNRMEAKKNESESEMAIFQVKDETNYSTPYKLLRHLEDWTFYPPMRVDQEAPVRSPQLARSGLRLFPDGSNLSSVLQAIQSQHPVIWDEICEILGNVYDDFRNLSFPPEGGDGKILLRWWEHPFEKEEGATTLSRLTEEELTDWLDKFKLGDLWLAGHLGARP